MVCVSVIVAVYQAEKYIRRCLDSLRNQSFQEYEVLLIDDGSSDASSVICDEYAEKSNLFRVFHKQNGGVSTARQLGLESALGEYVIHVDPDDWVEPNMLQELYDTAKSHDYDVVVCDFFEKDNHGQTYVTQKPTSLNHKDYFFDLISKLHGSCCNKLVRRKCFLDYDVYFPAELNMWEDKYVNLKIAQHPISVGYLPKAFYHYDKTMNVNCSIFSYSEKRLNSQKFVIDWLSSQVENQDLLIDLKKRAKYTAFWVKDFPSVSFRNLYKEINSVFDFDIKKIGRLDFFIFLAMKFSLPISNALCRLKTSIHMKLLG